MNLQKAGDTLIASLGGILVFLGVEAWVGDIINKFPLIFIVIGVGLLGWKILKK